MVCACKTAQSINAQNPQQQRFLEDSILQTADKYFENFIANKDSFHLQIIYTKIDRDKNNRPAFTDYTFNTSSKNYFYPASTVKMPVAFLALQKINELKKPELFDAAMITETGKTATTGTYNDPKTNNGKPSIKNYIEQIFLVSDNNAFNRLYEFLGQEYINKSLAAKGYNNAAIRHRLSVVLNEDQNRSTNAVSFYKDSIKIFEQPAQYSKYNFNAAKISLGKGYYTNGKLVNKPFDFSLKNKIELEQLHTIFKSVVFPSSTSAKQKLNITNEQREFLLKSMSMYPKQSGLGVYNNYHDAYVKFLLFGSDTATPPQHIKVFNKSGLAYGFLTDVAYIIDTKNNIEFMVSATLLCNSDGIFNDDRYDYDKTGLPFFKRLGEALYNYELKRSRKYAPVLGEFDFSTKSSD